MFSISTTTPGAAKTVYICGENNVFLKASINITYQVCGTEVVSLTSTTASVINTYDESTGDKIIANTTFTNLFKSDSVLCPITTYTLMEKLGSSYIAYTKTDIKLDASNNIIVSTVTFMSKSLFIKAQTQASTSTPAYLPFTITVRAQGVNPLANLINMAPFYTDLPINKTVEFNF